MNPGESEKSTMTVSPYKTQFSSYYILMIVTSFKNLSHNSCCQNGKFEI